MSLQRGERDRNLDLIRAVAGLLVVSVHFFLNICYYYAPLQGRTMLLMSVLRMVCMTCVPLFLLLTGYLCCEKKLSARYFLGLVRVLLAYLLASAVCVFFRRFWLGEAIGLRTAIRMTWNFTGVATGWYIKMYIGLFLLIPFLNMLWQKLGSRRNRGLLVAAVTLVAALPGLMNIRQPVLPHWMAELYPLCYYFLGAYFRAYQPRPRWWVALLGVMGAAALGGGIIFWENYGATMQNTDFTEWAGPTVMLTACSLFLLLRQVDCGAWPGWGKWLVKKGAELSLGIYLVSWCFDSVYYRILWKIEPTVEGRLKWWIVMIPAVYLSGAVVAQLLEWARQAITRCINNVFPKAELR